MMNDGLLTNKTDFPSPLPSSPPPPSSLRPSRQPFIVFASLFAKCKNNDGREMEFVVFIVEN